MCGFVGIFGPEGSDVAPEIYEGLLAVQHRGQDAAGITTFTNAFHVRKGAGLVADVFDNAAMQMLRGNLGVGHVRYPTVGGGSSEDAQPFHHTYPLGVAMAHNGNVTNYVELTQDRFLNRGTRLNSTCDVELILWVFQDALARRLRVSDRITADDVFAAVAVVHEKVRGAYSVVATIADEGMVAFRDPFGIKPMVWGEKEVAGGRSWMCASESVVLDVNGYQRTREIGAGEAVFIDRHRALHQRRVTERAHRPCIFEYVYFARPDSFLDDVSVYKARRRFGEALAVQWMAGAHPGPDVVIPIPDSARDAAIAFADAIGVPYRDGFVKNRYIGRTFIMPNQQARNLSVRRKLNPIKLEFEGKHVLLLDDSIVRGTTSRRIVAMARDAGAREVSFAVTSPPLIAPCPYGIDMASKREFVATDRTHEEIARFLGADRVVYLEREAMNTAVRAGNPKLDGFCNACFTGDYPTGDMSVERLQNLEGEREQHGARTSVGH
ncbi:MAG: amidophosphoribosyltransferase [Planctomycetes bacterium]|nr:amidophosphoribosyltransferase [Planctomycetota bacterium]